MPRFNAAKSWKKLDDDLSGKFNYLCDLLDEGYSSVALINNHEIAIDINPKDGIKIVNDGSSIFSLDPLTGEIVIGKYDGLISDLETDLGAAYNDIAQQLGYTDYDDMVAEAIAGNTIINGGWLRTSLIQANTILFDQLASAAVTSITDTIDLGGRNLLKDSDKDATNSNYALAGYTWANVSDMVPGEQYTVTIEGTLPAGLSWYLNVYAQSPTAYPVLAYLFDSDKVSANKWVKTVTMPNLSAGQSFTGQTSLYQFPLGGGQTVSVTRIKIERGNKSTDWTPAPEDKLSEGVSYAGIVINATNGVVTTATIDGESAKVIQNATDGIAFYQDDGLGGWDKRGGLSLINGKLVLTIDVLANNSDVLNFVTFEPYYVWNGQTFAGTQYWTDDADASPASVQHLLLLGDVNKASAESQTIISAVALNSSGTDLGYETNLKIGSMVPTQAGDGNYGYAEFIGNTSGGGGSAMLGAGNSDGSDHFNLNVFHNELNVWDETGELFELTRAGGLKVLGNKVWHEGNDGSGSGLDADLLYGCTKASITGRQCYNYANGVLVSLIPVANGQMFFIHVTGNSYASAYGPIDTIIQGYWYQTGFLQCKQTNNGAYLAPAKFMTDGGYFKCWFQQPSVSSTLFIKCYTHGDGLINPESITNVTEPTGADKVACTLFDSYVPLGRTVNSKALSSNITLDAADVGAVPTARTVSAGTGLSGGGALSSNITLSLGTLPTNSVMNAQVKTTTASSSGTLTADGYVYLNSGTGQMFLPNVNASFRVHLSGQTDTTSYYGAIGLHNTSSSSNGYTVRWTRIASS